MTPDSLARAKIHDWAALSRPAQARLLQRPASSTSVELRNQVAGILRSVSERGDAAVREYAHRFDGVQLDAFVVDAADLDGAQRDLPRGLRAAIIDAAGRIALFHRTTMAADISIETAPGVRCERISRPIGRVGLYVPAGSAPLPSTALMLGIPAQLAGCSDVVLCTPPGADGRVDPAVLFAARLCGIERVYRIGGAQAIAAMAYGAGPISACDKLFGPGNAWVTEAKRQVAALGIAAIDMPAGPSELLVIADPQADAEFIAADLLSQAEHGADSQVLLLSDAPALLSAVANVLQCQCARLPRATIAQTSLAHARLIAVPDLSVAFEISNRYAPEHLILALANPRDWLPRVQAAGAVFLGEWTPEALGDYCSGSNHVLPTGGAARACSGLSVAAFQTSIAVQEATPEGIATIGDTASIMARAEGLVGHARAVEIRLQRLQAAALQVAS